MNILNRSVSEKCAVVNCPEIVPRSLLDPRKRCGEQAANVGQGCRRVIVVAHQAMIVGLTLCPLVDDIADEFERGPPVVESAGHLDRRAFLCAVNAEGRGVRCTLAVIRTIPHCLGREQCSGALENLAIEVVRQHLVEAVHLESQGATRCDVGDWIPAIVGPNHARAVFVDLDFDVVGRLRQISRALGGDPILEPLEPFAFSIIP